MVRGKKRSLSTPGKQWGQHNRTGKRARGYIARRWVAAFSPYDVHLTRPEADVQIDELRRLYPEDVYDIMEVDLEEWRQRLRRLAGGKDVLIRLRDIEHNQ